MTLDGVEATLSSSTPDMLGVACVPVPVTPGWENMLKS